MTLSKTFLCALAGGAALAFSAVNASAAIVCSGDTCWHAHESYQYPPSAHVIIHGDDWHAGPGIRFHEHEGRGYWNGGRWTAW